MLKILQPAWVGRASTRAKRKSRPLSVGRHRVQLGIEQLPAIAGQQGFEYKVGLIHLAPA
jgi:hypothetical protein